MRIPDGLARPLPWWVNRQSPESATVPGPFVLQATDESGRSGPPFLGCMLTFDVEEGWRWQDSERNHYLGFVDVTSTEAQVVITGYEGLRRMTLTPVDASNAEDLNIWPGPGEEPWQEAWDMLCPVYLRGSNPAQFASDEDEPGAIPMPDDAMPEGYPWPQG